MSMKRGCLCDIDKFIYVYEERMSVRDIDKFIYVAGERMSVRHGQVHICLWREDICATLTSSYMSLERGCLCATDKRHKTKGLSLLQSGSRMSFDPGTQIQIPDTHLVLNPLIQFVFYACTFLVQQSRITSNFDSNTRQWSYTGPPETIIYMSSSALRILSLSVVLSLI